MRKIYLILSILAVVLISCAGVKPVSTDHTMVHDSVYISHHDSVDIRRHTRDSVDLSRLRMDSIIRSYMRDSIWTDRAHYERTSGDTVWIRDTVTRNNYRYFYRKDSVHYSRTDTIVLHTTDTIYVLSKDSVDDHSTLSENTDTTVQVGKSFAEYSGILMWVGVAIAVILGLIILAIKLL